MCLVLGEGVFYDGITFICAEHNADWRVVAFVHQFAFIIVNIHLHLSQILMRQVSDLKVDEDKALQDIVVKYKVYSEMPTVKRDSFLSCDE